jgi:hypothetical protein
MRRIDVIRQTRFAVNLNRRHQIKPQQCKVGQIVLRQTFAGKLRVNASQTAKAVSRNASASEIRHLDTFRRADHNIFDLSFAIDENADLSAGFKRYFR